MPTHNTGTHAEIVLAQIVGAPAQAVLKDTGSVQPQETGDRSPEQRQTPPNQGVEPGVRQIRRNLKGEP